jgi:hypothetical protein
VPDAVVGTTDIYFLRVGIRPDRNNPGAFTLDTPETPTNAPFKLQTSTSDPSIDPNEAAAQFDPNYTSNEDYPTWPQYINSYRIAFQSDRGNNLNIWAATILDINAPALLKYDIRENQILQVSRDGAPNVAIREVSAGERVRFRTRFADFQTGVAEAYIQIKTPEGQTTSADGLEHRTYFSGGGALDTTASLINAPFEWDYQAINPNVGTPTFRENGFIAPSFGGGIDPDWPGWNLYVPSIDDEEAFTGVENRPDPDFWLRIWDDGPTSAGGHEPEGETRGDGVFTAAWTTPVSFPSDWILDVIAYDNSINPFLPTQRSNWKIYDNVWGFTSRPFVGNGTVLYVNDYACGQKFFSARFGPFQTGILAYTAWGVESWMTEIPLTFLPTQYFIAPATVGPVLNQQTTLGQFSYADALTNDGSSIPITQRYDHWRIISRGPLPESVLNQYGARIETQPADVLAGGTGPRQQVVAEKCIIWHAPYSGDLFVGSGTLVDTNVQNQLRAFVQRGGRMLVTGQDIAWALSLGGGTQNAFLDSVLKVRFVRDFLTAANRNQINTVAGVGAHPITAQTWYQDPPFHQYPAPPPTLWEPPSTGPLYLGPIPNTPRGWRAPNQDSFDVVDFIPEGAALANDLAGIDANYAAADAAPTPEAIMWALDNATTRGKTVFSPFGWEGITPEHFTLQGTPTPYVLRNRRTQLMHNALDYLRTGRIVGQIRDINGAQPVSQVFIRAIDLHNGQVAGTTLSQADGSYSINGLDATGIYTVDIFRAGFITQHLQGTPFHGGYQSRLDVFLTPAQPGTINGVVTVQGSNTPVAGAIVEATNPVTNEKRQATTDTLGRYRIDAPVITDPANPNSGPGYIVRIINLTQLGYGSSIPPSYGGGETGAGQPVRVGPNENVTGIDFQVKPIGGTIRGRVLRRSNNAPIAGATVTATNGAITFTATTGSDGTFLIENVDPGTYGVVASAPGFGSSASISAAVASLGEANVGDILLDAVPPGTITGLVQTNRGIPISGATVSVVDAAGNVVNGENGQPLTTTTNANTGSNYTIGNVPAGGTVLVRARKDGYQPDPTPSVSVNVPSGGTASGVNFTLNPLFQFSNTLSLVSAPFNYTKPVTELFGIPAGDVTNGNFLFVTWDETADRYINATTFQLGKGYFLESKNTSTSLSVIESGTPAAQDPFPIPLKEGWNMIGTPFNFPLNLYGLKVIDGGATIDIAAAQSGNNPALGGALWTYESGGYQLAYTLDPWRGYWIRAFRDVTLLVPSTARQDRSVKFTDGVSRAPEFGNARGDGWSLDLIARAGTVLSAPSRIGITRSATDSYDRYKLESPPAVGDDVVTLTTQHSDWGNRNGKYSMDVRSAASVTQTWDFTVTSNVRNSPVTLQWPGVATVPGKIELILTDVDNKTTLDMRTRSSYTLPATQDNLPRHLRVEMRRATRQSLQIVGLTATVNRNSTTRAATSAAINYRVTADADTQVVIMQNGKRIRTLETGRHRSAGSADALWDLKDDKGAPVGSNQYTVEVRATDSTGRVRRQVVPLLITR